MSESPKRKNHWCVTISNYYHFINCLLVIYKHIVNNSRKGESGMKVIRFTWTSLLVITARDPPLEVQFCSLWCHFSRNVDRKKHDRPKVIHPSPHSRQPWSGSRENRKSIFKKQVNEKVKKLLIRPEASHTLFFLCIFKGFVCDLIFIIFSSLCMYFFQLHRNLKESQFFLFYKQKKNAKEEHEFESRLV